MRSGKTGERGTSVSAATAVRLPAELIRRIDLWARQRDATRRDAICALVEIGLAAKETGSAAPRLRERAATLAGQQLDRMGDAAATTEERANRKSRLADGPSVFRDVRRDRPKRSAKD